MAQIKSFRTTKFHKLLDDLNPIARKQAEKAYQLWLENPWHNSLDFKNICKKGSVYSARVSLDIRALGVFNKNKNEVIWFWIGIHEDYNQLIKKF